MVTKILQHRCDAAGNPAFHVDRAAAVHHAVLHLAREGAMRPGAFIARRHHVGMAGKGDVGRLRANARIEIVDIGGAGLAEDDAVRFESRAFQDGFENAQRPGIGRGYGWAADEGLGNRDGISHVPGLTRMAGGGPDRWGSISISLSWSHGVLVRSRSCALRGRICSLPSGFGPYWLVHFVPRKK